MNDTFLQQNPLKMFDDFVEIPDEVFNNNFVNCIAVKMSEATGVKMSHAR